MLSNKLYGVWGYSEEKPSNIVVLSFLNYQNKISQISQFTRLSNQKEEIQNQEQNTQAKYLMPSFLASLNAPICSNSQLTS